MSVKVENDQDSESNQAAVDPKDKPSQVFLNVCKELNPDVDNELQEKAWKQYSTVNEQCVLEGNEMAWIACAVYLAMWQDSPLIQEDHQCRKYPLANLIRICKISVLEFFDKLSKWVDMVNGPRRLQEHVSRIQSSLAVSAVVYKKLLPIFRRVFVQVESKLKTSLDCKHIFEYIWTLFICLKKQLPNDDLMNSYNLLLCSVDFIVHDLRRSESRIHFLNTEFLHSIPNDDDAAVLETLCRQFEGVVLDAKHFRTHWWLPRLSRLRSEHILLINPDFTSFLENIGINMTNIHKLYEEEITKRGEMDERMFIPADISTVFDEAFDASAVEQLRRSELDETWVFDAELLLRMSAQSCLERLNEQKQQATPLSCKSYVISGDQFCPVSPISASLYNVSKLDDLLRNDWDFNDSELDRIMLQWRDNPKEFIVNCVRNMGDELERKVASEREAQDGFDKTFTQMIKARRSSTDALFYRLLEKVVIAERLRSACMEVPDLSSVLHKEELIASIYACCLELVIFTYSSERTFPWSIELLKLAPIHFYKVIELIIRAEPELSREMVKHLNKVEERVLEELSWAIDSPLWSTLARRPDGVPSSQSVSLSTMESYSQRAHNTIGLSQRFTASPMKMPHSAITVTNAAKRRLEFEEDEAGPAKRIAVESDWTTGACSSSTLLFFRKVYFLAAVRLQDLCERVRLDEKGRQRVWTLFEHILRTETSLMAGRHLDQNLMCCIYVVSKIGKQDISFHDIMHHYRHQPQASSRIYRRVLIDQAISPSVMSDDNASRDSIGSCSGGKLRSGSALPVPGMGSAPPTPEPQNLDYTDLIKYYNRVFVSRVEYFAKKLQPSLIDLKENGISLLSMPLVRCHTLSPRRLIADHVSVLPMSSIPASPVRPLRYSFNRSPSKDLKTINAVVGAAIRPLSYTISPCQATTYRHQHFAARSLS